MAGDETSGMLAARVLSEGAAARDLSGPAGATQQHFRVLPLHTLVRFGKWEAVLAERQPTPATTYTDGVWHWARGMAFARQGKLREASTELAKARKAGGDPALARQEFKNINSLARLLEVANGMLAAEVAAAGRRFHEAERLARAAVKAEDALYEDEPPAWHAPTRQTLGAVLLAAGKKGEAARTFREDLARLPGNGWSTAGLAAVEGRPASRFPAGRY
jgi:tetratricopeptide (TPR) repeat protein